ncbi:MAG TPA: Imm1 family immunity protein [Armatimonadota bacterium]|nr:Imm1 family immunity protein [Armatimonadota bacterium]
MWSLTADNATNFKRKKYRLKSVTTLRRRLDELAARGDGTLYLHGPPSKDQYLVLGVEQGVGLAHYFTPGSLSLIAANPEPEDGADLEFNFGGTATPIRRRYCIPIPLMRSIAEAFLENGELPTFVTWEVFYG